MDVMILQPACSDQAAGLILIRQPGALPGITAADRRQTYAQILWTSLCRTMWIVDKAPYSLGVWAGHKNQADPNHGIHDAAHTNINRY